MSRRGDPSVPELPPPPLGESPPTQPEPPVPWLVALAGLADGVTLPGLAVLLHPYWSQAIVADGGRAMAPLTVAYVARMAVASAVAGVMVSLALAAVDRVAPGRRRTLKWSLAGGAVGLVLVGVRIGTAMASASPGSGLPRDTLARTLESLLYYGGTAASFGYILTQPSGQRRPALHLACAAALVSGGLRLLQTVGATGTAPARVSAVSPWRPVSQLAVLQLVGQAAAHAVYGACFGYAVAWAANKRRDEQGLGPMARAEDPPIPRRLRLGVTWVTVGLTVVFVGALLLQHLGVTVLGPTPGSPGWVPRALVFVLWRSARNLVVGSRWWFTLAELTVLWACILGLWLKARRHRASRE